MGVMALRHLRRFLRAGRIENRLTTRIIISPRNVKRIVSHAAGGTLGFITTRLQTRHVFLRQLFAR